MKTEQDYIREAVELAVGFSCYLAHDQLAYQYGDSQYEFISTELSSPDQYMLDALAAQLVRQVDALDDYWFDNDKYGSCVVDSLGLSVGFSESPTDVPYDRTMNAIRAIVDSGVLKNE